MGDAAARAAELVRKADKKLASFSFFGNKYEDAGEWLEKAAVQFKLAQACAPAIRTCRGQHNQEAALGAAIGLLTGCLVEGVLCNKLWPCLPRPRVL